MAGEVKVDYSQLQGESFFGVAIDYMTYLNNRLDCLKIDEMRVAGKTAIFGIASHKSLLKKTVNPAEDSAQNMHTLFVNTGKMMEKLGVEFSQIDERMKQEIERK